MTQDSPVWLRRTMEKTGIPCICKPSFAKVLGRADGASPDFSLDFVAKPCSRSQQTVREKFGLGLLELGKLFEGEGLLGESRHALGWTLHTGAFRGR